MILQWGCDMADLLFISVWLESTEDGRSVYKKFGFYDPEPVEGGLPRSYMRTAIFHVKAIGVVGSHCPEHWFTYTSLFYNLQEEIPSI
ncbi:hypothetical protein F4808DRAFT_434808 [Astrocystis sublimbata]|nr:hypothetical protein F4808DRAFT_446829 [Astrocystis sublimbata]KAI0198700.1 hypothetical protein F4808DRAFT_434808 [Astrocystis sublimbata]